jgi:zinc protease
VFQLRLTEEMREKEGVSYAPSAAHGPSSTWGNYGYLAAQIEAPPASLQRFFVEAQRIADDLASKPIEADELPARGAPRLNRSSGRVTAMSIGSARSKTWAKTRSRSKASAPSAPTSRRLRPPPLLEAAKRYLVGARAFRVQVLKEPAGKSAVAAALSSSKD